MMNLGQVFSRIEQGIQDPSFTREGDILPRINDFLLEMGRSFRLPAHQSIETVTIPSSATANHVALPTTFSHNLFRVYNRSSVRMVNVRSGIKALEALYDGMTSKGFIQDVAVDEERLWFRPMPSQGLVDQQLELFFYRKPVLIDDASDDDQLLDGIPEHLVPVAVDYVLWRLFLTIEDGIMGPPVNTQKYERLFTVGLARFQEYCLDSPKAIPVVARSARFF